MVFTESEVVELKSQIKSDICKEVIAFANSKGGTLYIGVEDNGNIIGIAETDGDSFESMRSLEQNLTFSAAEDQFKKRNIPFDSSKMQTLDMLSQDGIYSNVALLLSDQCNHTIKVAAFAGMDKTTFQDRREFSGSLFQQMEELYAYLDMRNQTKATFEGLYRVDTRDYPEEALREALLNSLVHRDYSFSASTLVNIYDDRIEFVSIGGLPAGISLDDIMLGLSICRNPKLAAIFYRLELIEAYGTGLPKIFKAYNETGFEPKIEVSNNAFKITLPNRNAVIKPESCSSFLYELPTPYDKSIIEFIDANKYIVRSDVDKLLNVSQATSNRILKRLVENGTLYQVGNGKNTKYIKK